MVQGFYNLEEAAQRLGVSAQEVLPLAKAAGVRPFADRGTWQFRRQDIDELARKRGMQSDPDLQLSDVAAPRTPQPKPAAPPTAESLASAVAPRVWYLTPGYELAAALILPPNR